MELDGTPTAVRGIIVPPSEVDRADELAAGTIERGFDGDTDRLRRFVAALVSALPAGTLVALRGSAVAGRSFRTGAPFDDHGPGTSDLDIVVLGDEALELFSDEAKYLGGINTAPASDDAPWVAPRLEKARRRAQAIARRPVSIQAQAPWFLGLRARLQRQPYVILDRDE
ncbi:MAG TPA: hypothetical protein VIR16_05530 [Candidatus Limnocylindrales bacterium]